MKRIILFLCATLCAAISMNAQPKAIGGRIGVTGFEMSYEHNIRKADFVEVEAGLDFGYNASGKVGFKATGIYNFTFARPAWTQKGSWGLYAGPGLSLGYTEDQVKVNKNAFYLDHGFMLSFVAQLGMEYTFWFPLQISVDLRPMFGMHIADTHYSKDNDIWVKYRGGTAGYYDNGWLGFAPTISVRYRF